MSEIKNRHPWVNMKKKAFLIILLSTKCGSLLADDSQTKVNTKFQSYSVGLGATRIIYNYPSSGSFISVSNPNGYPILVQSKITDEDKTSAAPFIVTPPLFRLDENQQSRVKIVMTEPLLVNDRESLKWLCVTGIPPEKNDAWVVNEDSKKSTDAELQVKVRISRCIKLMIRPADLKGGPKINSESISWSKSGEMIRATNPGPYILSPGMLKIGGSEIANPEHIPAFGYRDYLIPKGEQAIIKWTLITDEGITAGPFETTAK